MDARADHDLSLDQLVELERLDDEAARTSLAPTGGDAGGGHTDDDEIVLPWWQHPVNIVTLVVTAAILAAMVGWMVGDSGAEPAHNDVDSGFLQDMQIHHEQAVLMAIIYRNLPDTDPGLRTVARQIVTGQNIEIGRMIQLQRTLGDDRLSADGTAMAWMGMATDPDSMPGMATDDELDELGRLDGAAADTLFVELMSEHHAAGAVMANYEAANGENAETVEMAQSMAEAQTAEIREMDMLLGGG